MTRKYLNSIKIDNRSTGDIRKEIAEKAGSYTPEWIFDEKNPDAGSVIAHIFANQLSGNIDRFNQIFDKYSAEFVNLLGISLLPATPARGVVAVDLVSDTVEGVEIHKGTKFVGHGDTEESERVVFESTSDVYVTNSRLSDVFMVSGNQGKIVPVLGGLEAPEFVTENKERMEEVPEANPEREEFEGVTLFDFDSEGIQKNGVVFLSNMIFDTDGEEIKCRFSGKEDADYYSKLFANESEYRISYYTESGFKPCEAVHDRGGFISMLCLDDLKHINIDGDEYSAILIESIHAPKTAIEVTGVQFASECAFRAPDFIYNQNEECIGKKIYPFGESLGLFEDCFIGSGHVFGKRGSTVTLKFNLSFDKKFITFTQEQEEESLKPIKKKPKNVINNVPAEARAEIINIEYFNGKGFKKLPVSETFKNIFDGSYTGEVEISFDCPTDWEKYSVGGFEERSLRIQLMKADNCYLQPCFHYMPVLENIRLSYTYEGDWVQPDIVQTISGVHKEDITKQLHLGNKSVLFSPLDHLCNAVYFGFDKQFAKAPLSILFDIKENSGYSNEGIRFEYSSQRGFKQMKVVDHTNGLSNAGTFVFVPPMDMISTEEFGLKRYWIRIVDGAETFNNPRANKTYLKNIIMNAIEVINVEAHDTEDFFIDSTYAGMSFPLNAENILDAEVFVNELDCLPINVMRQMAEDHPEDVRVSYNQIGEVTEFMVRWKEVEDFYDSENGARHYRIDRLNRKIIFGDGIGAKLPTYNKGIAFTVKVRCCDGANANLPKNAIDETAGNILYINNISNPVATFAGSDMEDMSSARERGANILSSGNRLVSEMDYIREISSFSQEIKKVRCIIGSQYSDDRIATGSIYVAILMRDYKEGVYSFNLLKDRLAKHLLEKCEETVRPSDLCICEPTFVKLNIDVWVNVESIENAFKIQNAITEGLNEYIDPESGNYHDGWDIGNVPTMSQIRMLLYSIGIDATINQFTVTASYSDEFGDHVCDLSELEITPFMLAVNGKHTVIINVRE